MIAPLGVELWMNMRGKWPGTCDQDPFGICIDQAQDWYTSLPRVRENP